MIVYLVHYDVDYEFGTVLYVCASYEAAVGSIYKFLSVGYRRGLMKMNNLKPSNLTVKPCGTFSHGDLPWGTSNYDLEPFANNHFVVKIGSYTVSEIWERKDGKFVIKDVHWCKYKSLDNAIKGLLKRLNEDDDE